MVIPIKVSFINSKGEKIKEGKQMILREETQNFVFSGFKDKPIPVYLNDFSAPIKFTTEDVQKLINERSPSILFLKNHFLNDHVISQHVQNIFLENLEVFLKFFERLIIFL